MANIKISQLTAAAAASGTQEFEVNDTLVSKKVTGDQVKAFVKSGFVASDISDVTSTAAELNKLTGVTATATELNHLAGSSTTLAAPLLANPQNYVDPENRIINGAFDFWQRGTSFSAVQYGADRWFNIALGGSVTMSRQAFTAGDMLGSNNPTYFMRQTVSGQSAAGDLANFQQTIEGVRSYAGQTVTLLGWARRSSGSGNMAVEVFQNMGTGGSPSSGVYVTPQTIPLTPSWSPFAVTISIPSISGKTLGTNNNDNLLFSFFTSAGSDYNARTNSLGLQTIGVDLWGIHIKLGVHTADATALYKQPELGPELARCQRYYEVGQLYAIGGTSVIGSAQGGFIFWKEVKRAAPSVTQTNLAAINISATPQLAVGSDPKVGILSYRATTSSDSWQYQENWTADAEL